jgi:hypothetical protein
MPSANRGSLTGSQAGKRHGPHHPNHVVKGTVTSTRGEAAPDLDVQLIVQAFRAEIKVGSAKSDAKGAYQILLPHAKTKAATAIFVRVSDGETAVAQSAVQFVTKPLVHIDLTVDPSHVHAPTEFEKLVNDVTARIGKVGIGDLREDSKSRDITFLSGATGWSVDKLTDLVVAYRLGTLSSIAPAFFYALLRQGTLLGGVGLRLISIHSVDLSTPVQPLFYAAVLVPPDTIRAAVTAAIDARGAPGALRRQVDRILATLAKSTAAAQAYFQTEQPTQILNTVATNVAAGKHVELANVLQAHGHGSPIALADAIDEIRFVAPDAAGKGMEQVLSPLLAAELTQLTDVQKLIRAIGTPTPPAPAGKFDAAALTGSPAQARRAEKRFPTAAFAANLASAPSPSKTLPNAGAVAQLLQANPKFDLATGNIDRLLSGATAAGTVDAAKLRDQLKKTQRVFKLAPSFRQTTALLDAGVHSAAQIAAMGRNQFVQRFSGDGTFTAAEATAVFQKATDVHLASTLLAAELRSISAAASTAALASPAVAEGLKRVSQQNPNLKNLFALTDLCECVDCRSITSPAAYLVDVLHYLENRIVVDATQSPPLSSRAAKQVLFARRPDLGEIDLTCDNTNVPLPYIDVVCELLEEAVAPDAAFAFSGTITAGAVSAALLSALQAKKLPFTSSAYVQDPDGDGNFYVRDTKVVCKLTPAGAPNTWTVRQLRQTFRSAAELAAAPEYVNDAAYLSLQTSPVAFHLPFDLYHEEARTYFAQFGFGRDQLMRALAVGGVPAARDIAADALDLNDAERAILAVDGSAEQALYWNTGASDPATIVNVVDTFLTRTELQYADLQDLLARQYINPGNTLFIQHQDSSCDTTKQVIVGLDAAALDRIHRFRRLQRRLGWSIDTLDRAIVAPRLGNGQISDDQLLVRLADLVQVQARLRLSLDELIIYYGLIPTDGDPSRYAQIFLNPTANGTVDDRLQLVAVTATRRRRSMRRPSISRTWRRRSSLRSG